MRGIRRATNRYVDALKYGKQPAPSSYQFVSGRATSSDLGDIDGAFDFLSDAGKSVLGTVDEKAKKLETALKVILVFSGIAAVTGIANLIRKR